MSNTYVEIQRAEMVELLEGKGFVPLDLKGTKELVMGKRVDLKAEDGQVLQKLTIRVFTSVVAGSGRGCGEDAIRVCLVGKSDSGNVIAVGKSKRINRVAGWQDRLQQRIAKWDELMGEWCDRCLRPMKERKGKHGKFWGCTGYPECRGTKEIEE